MRIGITGSLSSGKSSVAKILSNKKDIVFSADKVVKKLYTSKKFKKIISKKFKIKTNNIKQEIKKRLLNKKISLKELGKIIHPTVRRNDCFFKKKQNKNVIIFEIPLLRAN